MPGAKEYVSIDYKQHKQKRLLLGNLSELRAEFKEKFQVSKVGFSKFCALYPSGARQLVLQEPILYVCVPSMHAAHNPCMLFIKFKL